MEELLPLLAAGGDIGIWVVVAVLWKFDRRIFRLETIMKDHDDLERKTHGKPRVDAD